MRCTPRVLLLTAGCLIAAACGQKSPTLVSLPETPPPAVLIRNVAVFDADAGTVTAGRDVTLRGSRIEGIAATGAAPAAEGTMVLDGTGATLLPGLIDSHAHLGSSSAPSWLGKIPDPEANMRAYLYCGVTTVLEPGDQAPAAFKRRAAVAAGELLGPTIYTAGPFITAEGGHPVPIIERLAPWWIRSYLISHRTRQVTTPDEARNAVQELAASQPDVIKVMVDRIPQQIPRLERETIAAVVDEAKKAGLRTVAHIGALQDALDAADAGVSLWVHGVYKDKLTPEQAAQLASYRIPMIPTMWVFENYALLGQGPRVATPLEREIAPAEILAAFDQPPADSAASTFFRPYIESLRPLRATWRDNVRLLREAGVTILAGSDTQSGVFPGAGLHRELHLLTEAGLTPAQALRAATSDAARFLANGKEPDFGLIAPGKIADLLLVEGDPTQSLDALSRIRAVIKNGVPLERIAAAQGT